MENLQEEFVISGTETVEEALEEFSSYGEKYKLILSSIEKTEKLLKQFSEFRINKNLSQRDLSDLTGIKQPQIARYEKKTAFPRIDTFLRLLEALDLQLVLEKQFKPLIKFGSFDNKYISEQIKQNNYNTGRYITYER